MKNNKQECDDLSHKVICYRCKYGERVGNLIEKHSISTMDCRTCPVCKRECMSGSWLTTENDNFDIFGLTHELDGRELIEALMVNISGITTKPIMNAEFNLLLLVPKQHNRSQEDIIGIIGDDFETKSIKIEKLN